MYISNLGIQSDSEIYRFRLWFNLSSRQIESVPQKKRTKRTSILLVRLVRLSAVQILIIDFKNQY